MQATVASTTLSIGAEPYGNELLGELESAELNVMQVLEDRWADSADLLVQKRLDIPTETDQHIEVGMIGLEGVMSGVSVLVGGDHALNQVIGYGL